MQIFRLVTAHMKINQLSDVFFKPPGNFSLNIASPFSLITYNQKDTIKVQFIRLLSALMKVHPIPHAIFETTRLQVYSDFESLFSVMKDNSSVFL